MAELRFSQTSHAVYITTGHSEPVPAQYIPVRTAEGGLKVAWKKGGVMLAGATVVALILGMIVAVKLASVQTRVETKAFGIR